MLLIEITAIAGSGHSVVGFYSYNCHATTWASERFFQGRGQGGDSSFSQLSSKLREKPFSAENLIAKHQISNPRGLLPPPPSSDAHGNNVRKKLSGRGVLRRGVKERRTVAEEVSRKENEPLHKSRAIRGSRAAQVRHKRKYISIHKTVSDEREPSLVSFGHF